MTGLITIDITVPPDWIDYNGHMNDSRYTASASRVGDVLLEQIGAGLAYVATGRSYYSVESHVCHLGEAKLGQTLRASLQILSADDKRLHVFVRITRGEDLLATVEQMLLHVDMAAARACPADPEVLARLAPIVAAHAALPHPAQAGRHVGAPRRPVG